MSGKLIVVLGGARSGKSDYAQARAAQLGESVSWVATAEPGDTEMRQRIAAHRAARPAIWHTVERTMRLGATNPPSWMPTVTHAKNSKMTGAVQIQ